MTWVCKTCGESHEDVPFSFAADYPDNFANLSPDQRDLRAIIGSDQCVIDQEQFYIRGCLEIPIRDSDGIFLWGLWASVWEEDYDEISGCWEEEGREMRHGPFKGRLGNALRAYDRPTFNVKLTVHIKPLGQRPLFFIDEPQHPLAIAQKNGITVEEAYGLSSRLLHNT